MTKEVKRYSINFSVGGMLAGDYVNASDYAALEQECERLRNQRDAILLQARIWACEAKAQQSIAREVSEALGGIPTWGPISSTVTERLAERDDALLQVEALRADAERYRWLCDKFGITKLPCAIERILSGEAYVADGKTGIDAAIDAALKAKP
ncbi:hypothetical protein KLEP174_gp53 [Pseudomonas phage vB_PcuM_ KLEP17-4]|nr:hypothetical protein KLEP174_gp53 [Pseudomonas phage vB_PcuM_ KLEP17-4]